MNEFELLPNEYEIINMAKEYSRLNVRHKLLSHKGTKPEKQVTSHDKKEGDLLYKSFYVTCDIELAARKLYSIAPITERHSIRNIIQSKRNIKQSLEAAYTKASGINDGIDYAVTVRTPDEYCQLLRHIIDLQEKLLNILSQCSNLDNGIINTELITSYSLNKLYVNCYIDKARGNKYC